MGQVVDLSKIFQTLLQTVPIWAFIGIAVKYWISRTEKAASSYGQAILDIQKNIQLIELRLADSGVSSLKGEIEKLKESNVRHDMRIESLIRHVDDLKRKP